MTVEATYIVTKSQLAVAFEEWKQQVIDNPEGFDYAGDEYGVLAANHLIKLIKGEVK